MKEVIPQHCQKKGSLPNNMTFMKWGENNNRSHVTSCHNNHWCHLLIFLVPVFITSCFIAFLPPNVFPPGVDILYLLKWGGQEIPPFFSSIVLAACMTISKTLASYCKRWYITSKEVCANSLGSVIWFSWVQGSEAWCHHIFGMELNLQRQICMLLCYRG